MQEKLNEWKVIENKIHFSKIKRFPYKRMLGKSLTKYILECKEAGFTAEQTIMRLYKEDVIQRYIENNKSFEEKLKDNIRTSVCARYSEERMRGR